MFSYPFFLYIYCVTLRFIPNITRMNLFAFINEDDTTYLTMDFWSFVRDYAQTITAGGVIVALFISIFTLISQRKHSKYQTLIEVYKLVNTFEEREARKNVYEAFRIYMDHYYKKGIKIGGKIYFPKTS